MRGWYSQGLAPYIGVTGLTSSRDTENVVSLFGGNQEHILMIGVLASWKSLRSLPMKPEWKKQTPPTWQIEDILAKKNPPRVVNLVHLSTDEEHQEDLWADLVEIWAKALKRIEGFQVNATWPDLTQLKKFRQQHTGCRLVLQIGTKAIQVAGSTEGILKRLAPYIGTINDILLDSSGGKGQPLDPASAIRILSEIKAKGWQLGLGVAGGLGPDTLHLLEPVIKAVGNTISIDAQSALRTEDSQLDPSRVSKYLSGAIQILS